MSPTTITTWLRDLHDRAEREHDERFDAISGRADRTAFTIIEPVLLAAFVVAVLVTPDTVGRGAVLVGLGVLVVVVLLTRGITRQVVGRRAGLDLGSRDMPWTTLRSAIGKALAMPAAAAVAWSIASVRGDGSDVAATPSGIVIGFAVGGAVVVWVAWRGTRDAS